MAKKLIIPWEKTIKNKRGRAKVIMLGMKRDIILKSVHIKTIEEYYNIYNNEFEIIVKLIHFKNSTTKLI